MWGCVWGCCQRSCWINLLSALPEERFELCTSVQFSFGQDFLSRKGGGSRVVICWFMVFKSWSSLNLHLLGRIPDWFFTGHFHCLPFNLLAHSSCISLMRILHRKSLLSPCPGCSTALLPLAVFHSGFSPFSCFSPGTHFLATLPCRFHANKTGKCLELCRGGICLQPRQEKCLETLFTALNVPDGCCTSSWPVHGFIRAAEQQSTC